MFDLAHGVRVPLKFDEMTLKGDYGHFARMLIDVYLSKPLPNSLIFEVGEDYLFLSLDYENPRAFCSSCCSIGHVGSTCRRAGKLTPRRRPMIREGKKSSLHEYIIFTAPRTSLIKLRKIL